MTIFEGKDPGLQACDPDVLLRLVEGGDMEALDRITRCYGARLMAIGRRQCESEDRAEDAVQDALEAAANHLDSFRGEGSLENWLARMVTNACRRMQRGRKGNAALHTEFGEESDEGLAGPEELVATQRLGEELVSALGVLTPQDRAIVLLAEVNGWKGPEIAKSLGLSPGQVRTRLSRSRGQLRTQLALLWPEWATATT